MELEGGGMSMWSFRGRELLPVTYDPTSNLTGIEARLAACSENNQYVIGVCLGLLGSVGINVGQNIQSKGLKSLGSQQNKPCSSRTWRLGMFVFIVGSLTNFAAFAFAPATVCVALETSQYITNVIFNRFVNKVVIVPRIYLGVAMAICGTVFVVAFGPQQVSSPVCTIERCHEEVARP